MSVHTHRLPTFRFGFATTLLGHEASPPFPDSESALFQNAVRKQVWR